MFMLDVKCLGIDVVLGLCASSISPSGKSKISRHANYPPQWLLPLILLEIKILRKYLDIGLPSDISRLVSDHFSKILSST